MRKQLVACMVLLMASAYLPALDDPVRTEGGDVVGAPSVIAAGVRAFRGIPYAAPPVGPLRWRPPQPAATWRGVRQATEYSAICPQRVHREDWRRLDQAEQSEDCLYLNVWTPARTAADTLPVMVWIHGGALNAGAGSWYDGSKLATKGAVVVTINYRLGSLGFFAHPGLSAESPHGSSGNYGILDQIAALEWVHRNVAAFGGDPGRVTIFGESAGSWSVSMLMASPLARGLFQRAIGESGGYLGARMDLLREGTGGRPSAEQEGERMASAALGEGASDPVTALRAMPASEVAAKLGRVGPAADDWVFPARPNTLYRRGDFARVPLLLGNNADEGAAFVGAVTGMSVDAFTAEVRRQLGDLADDYLRVYPVHAQADVAKAWAAAFRDERHTWQMRTWARFAAGAGLPVWRYYFTRVPPGEPELGAFHGAEVPYVFDALGEFGKRPYTDADHRLADLMASYWVNFAATGDPNGDGLPPWPRYDAARDDYLELGDEVRVGEGLHTAACDLWSRVVAERLGEEDATAAGGGNAAAGRDEPAADGVRPEGAPLPPAPADRAPG